MKEISLLEFLQITLLLGSTTSVIGIIFFAYLIKRTKLNNVQKILYSIVRLLFSFLLTMVFWMFWIFEFDIMFFLILLPAFFSEILSILLFVLLIGKRFNF